MYTAGGLDLKVKKEIEKQLKNIFDEMHTDVRINIHPLMSELSQKRKY